MNSLCVLICDRHVSCPQANSAVQCVCLAGKQPGELLTPLLTCLAKQSIFKSSPTLSLSVFSPLQEWVFHQVVQFDWLQLLPLMALYFALRRLARRYMSWSTWKEVCLRLLDWAINPPPGCTSRHQRLCRNRLCRCPTTLPPTDETCRADETQPGPDVGRPFCACQPVIGGIWAPLASLKKSASTGYFILPSRIKHTLFCHQGLRIQDKFKVV